MVLSVDALYREYWQAIYGFLASHLRGADPAEIEDLTATVFERVAVHAAQYEDRGKPVTAWLYRIAANLLADRYRERHPELTDAAAADRPGGRVTLDAGSDQQDLALWLVPAVEKLPPQMRVVLVERYWIGASTRDTAALLGISENAVKQLRGRALRRLRRILEAA